MTAKLTDFTYAEKKTCPLCSRIFNYEKLYSKKIAPKSWDLMLRNLYMDSSAHPDPLIYSLVTCPDCYFTAYEAEFNKVETKWDLLARTELTKNSRLILNTLEVDKDALDGLRDLRTGLATHYIAEQWYKARSGLAWRLMRLALTGYRRAWLLSSAVDHEFVSAEKAARDGREALQEAETAYEQSYLTEKLPDGLFYGPDYGVNFGIESVPYVVAVINFMLSMEGSATSAERVMRFSKAQKFLQQAQVAVSKRGAQEIRNKVQDLREQIRAAEKSILSLQSAAVDAPASPMSVAAAQAPGTQPAVFKPETEIIDWGLHFDLLFEHYGVTYNPGDTIVREGEATNEIYFILSGKANVVKTYTTGMDTESRLLAVLGKGAFFGEMSLLDASPRFATVIALEPTRMIRVNEINLQAIIKSYPMIAMNLMRVLVRRMRNYDAFVQTQLMPLVASSHGETMHVPGEPSSPTAHVTVGLRTELQGLLQELGDQEYE